MNTTESEDGSVGPLREALMICAAAGMSGILRVTGDPGGAIHIADGLVAAIETPGAPTPEVLLLRSHRVTESGWDEAFAAAASSGGLMRAELTRREMVGSGELEVLLRTALADAMFVLASGSIEEYRAEQGPMDIVLPLEPGAEADGLLAEASRRIRTLATLPARSDRERVVAVAGAAQPGVRLGDGQDEILALADGRRTPRDLAFALGRGVYATMLQLARMQQAGLLTTVSALAAAGAAREPGRRQAPGAEPRGASGLPQRQRDQSAASSSWRRPWAPGRAPELRAPLGLLRSRANRDPRPGETS
jgi:hypothetical protein